MDVESNILCVGECVCVCVCVCAHTNGPHPNTIIPQRGITIFEKAIFSGLGVSVLPENPILWITKMVSKASHFSSV
jgi:hypothetical protein